ncbi:DUF1761 domain-containing protein [Rufibacter glacialis]|uniref:DUF1761 domain-containing protein n=1 Tax=Rufibacter glacialis TaxID=1259555 RepID=A0A5M8QT97_9BACT|nr:DUF1761 domain-containing protein [Rufibacter glacialis]KAA6437703.1 DUF1761 domain-containing protein [Rufibacter glacialis]GGK57064.1 hypothetical protein GCM10011405_01470 [Rufibacter glacialis]
MDISTALQDLNWLAVLAAAFSTFLIGGLWYSPLLFAKAWMRANKFTEQEMGNPNMAFIFGLAFVLSFFMALNLALFIGAGDTAFGATAGFMAGLGWVALAMGVISLFERRPLSYVLTNGGYMTVAFTVMGAILGGWN